MTPLTKIVVIALIAALMLATSARGGSPESDREALIALAKATGVDGWVNRSGWLTEEDGSPARMIGLDLGAVSDADRFILSHSLSRDHPLSFTLSRASIYNIFR